VIRIFSRRASQFYAASRGTTLSTNRRNRELRAPATNVIERPDTSVPGLLLFRPTDSPYRAKVCVTNKVGGQVARALDVPRHLCEGVVIMSIRIS
jgi:hypothetical protein